MISFLLTALLLAQALVAQAAKGSIKGSVIAADTGRPIAGAVVVVQSLAPTPPNGALAARPSATTDEQGRFEISALEPGSYGVVVDRVSGQGYTRQFYGSPQSGLNGISSLSPVTITSNQTVDDIVIRLTRGGTISGRILGSTGQPYPDAEVRIHRLRFDKSGAKMFTGEGIPLKVNDRGEYRFFGLDPGPVYLHAGPSVTLLVSTPGGEASRYAETTYYPRTANFTNATPIEVKPGVELTNMDIQLLPRPPVYSVRGRLLDSRTGQPPTTNIQPMLVPRDREVGGLRGYLPQYGPDGTFTLNDVVEGEYWISAQLRPPLQQPLPGQSPTFPRGLVAFQRITVRGADVSGVSLTFTPAVEVTGLVRSDGQLPTGVFVQLDTVRNGAFSMNMVAAPNPVAVDNDGTFAIPDVPQGEYRVRLSGLPSGVYAMQARVGTIDTLLEPVTINSTPPDRIEIALARGEGRVQGQLVNAQNEPVRNAQVVLIPDRLRSRADLYQTATTDASGQFSISGILAGEYKAFAWASLIPFQYFDQNFVTLFEDRGEPVLVEDRVTRTITIRQIP